MIFAVDVASPCTDTLVTFSQSMYNVSEGSGLVQLVLVLNGSLSTDITVLVNSVNDTATGKWSNIITNTCINNVIGGGVDYNSGPYSIKISAGATRMTFNVSINNDNILEDNEKFSLIINDASLPSCVITNSSGRTTVIIKNDDSKLSMTFLTVISIYVTGFMKTVLIGTFCILRNIALKC